MLVWRGLGFLVPLIFLACGVPCELIFNAIFGPKYYETHPWAIAVAIALSAVPCWAFARHLERRPARVFIDKTSGQEMTFRPNDSFMLIPVRFWPHVLVVAAIVLFIVQLFQK
jgi:hypothetical protein